MRSLIGIDGCRAGWVVAESDEELRTIDVRIEATLDAIFGRADAGDAVVAIDMPIGLPEGGPRSADALARARLGWPRMTSVFSAPCRPTLAATSYREACDLNFAARGRKVSKQSYAIMEKIDRVDRLMTPALQAHVREGHPEVAFAELAGHPHGLVEPKKTAAGSALRRSLLAAHLALPDIDLLHRDLGPSRTAKDDIIDALVCLLTARRITRGEALVLPADPEHDARGLRMEIVA